MLKLRCFFQKSFQVLHAVDIEYLTWIILGQNFFQEPGKDFPWSDFYKDFNLFVHKFAHGIVPLDRAAKLAGHDCFNFIGFFFKIGGDIEYRGPLGCIERYWLDKVFEFILGTLYQLAVPRTAYFKRDGFPTM